MKRIFKLFAVWWITFYLIVVPPFAYAASPAGWSFSAFDVSTSVVTAIKNGASASAAVARSPVTGNIAKSIIAGGVAAVAVPLAISNITGLALEAVDWVLDPANNTIKYKDKTAPDVITGTKYHFYQDYDNLKLYDTPQAACNISDLVFYYPHMSGFASRPLVWDGTNCILDPSDMDWRAYRIESVVIDTPNDYKTIPIPTIADKIYDNAKTDSNSRSVVNDAVKDYVDSGAADKALDNAKTDTDSTHNCGTGTKWNGSACVADAAKPADTSLDLSSILSALQSIYEAIKGLASAIVEPIKTVINGVWDWLKSKYDWWVKQWETFATGIKDFFTWFREEPEKPNPSDGIVPDVPIATDWQNKANGSYVNFGGSCPAPQIIPIQFMGASQNLTISYVPFCDFATKIRPAVILGAWIAGLMIITGGRTKE